MKNEFVLAFNEVLEEKKLPREVVLEALQAALASAYRRHVNASNAQLVDAKIDEETGKVTIYAEKEVVENVEDIRTEVSIEDAKRAEPEADIGSMVIVETTPNNFGRVAAQTARQVIQQRIREAEREAQFNHFSQQTDEIINGVVQAVNSQAVTLGLEMKAEGIMPRSHQIPGERFRVHDRVRALLLEVKSSPRGPQIILSRAHRNFLRRLLENEVPEIYHGMVEIRSIAREPGHRSKIAVAALQAGVDPVGACVGIRGVRIQAIVRELNDEKIDVIEWNTDSTVFIAKALSPARVSGVYLLEDESGTKTAMVVVPEDQLSLAIGRDGQNARLAAKLTSWRIDIMSLLEAATNAIYKLENNPEFAQIAESEHDTVPKVEAILAKKSEGRPVTPEEYRLLTKFVDHVESGLMRKREDEKKLALEQEKIARANIPPTAFEISLSKFEVSDRLYTVISETGVDTVGDIMLQLETDPDSIWRLNGMGPKSMAELEESIDQLKNKLRTEEEALKAKELEEEQTEEGVIEDASEELEAVLPKEEVETEVVAEEKQKEPKETSEIKVVVEGASFIEDEKNELSLISEEDRESLEELFTSVPEEVNFEDSAQEDLDEIDDEKKKKKSKRKKFIEIEYDPDADMILTHKKHKRNEADWEEKW